MTLGIYHAKDLDGLACQALIKRFYPEAELLGWDYAYKMDEDTLELLNEADKIIMADVTLPREYMMSFADKIYLFDHHVTAWDQLKNLPFETYQYYPKMAACELLWEYHGKTPIPEIINLLGSYDVWRDNGTERWNKEILPVQLALLQRWNDAPSLIDMAIDDEFHVRGYIELGAQLIAFERSQFVIPGRELRPVHLKGHDLMVVNATLNPGRFMDCVYEEYGYEKICVYRQNKDGRWSYSLRSKAPHTVNDLAKEFGGGGHPQAAGFTSRELIF